MGKTGSQAGSNNPAHTHGHTTGGFSSAYHSWASMMQRCTNPKRRSYKHYGGRGITVCLRWRTFENFLADMGDRPDGKTIDRWPDKDGNYEPGNCRWATNSEQARNSSQTVMVEINGETRPLVEWCERRKISVNTVRCRVKKHGWDYARAIVTPARATCTGGPGPAPGSRRKIV